ncbi:MAG: DUF58 domain-containing protein [Nanoarchaeota archaeon]|nr:DUF58 domain-containing protein [Nanoarchaeota archaeon]
MIDTGFLDQLARFNLVVNKRVTSSYIGPRKSIAKGRGIMFKEHRIYAPGDDFRSIDWKVFARTDNLYVKTYEEERNLNVHIILDISGSMNFGKPVSKFDYAAMLGVGFAYLALKDNEKFQFATFSEQIEIFEPKRGMSQLASMIDYLNNLKMDGHSKLRDCLYQYKRFIGTKSLIIIISDFLVDIEEIREALFTLGTHQIKVLHVLDPIEKKLNVEGDFKLHDAETNTEMITYIGTNLREHYRDLITKHSANIEKACLDLGYTYHQITTDKPVFNAFYEILQNIR